MRRLLFLLLIVAAAMAALVKAGEFGLGPVVVTREDEQKLILLLKNPRDEATKPGISLRIPFLEEVRTFDRRWLHLNSKARLVQTMDRERVVVDNYVIWRIADPLQFYKSFPTGIEKAELQIDREVGGNLREVVGQHSIPQVLTEERESIMNAVTEKSAQALVRFGIEVRDVRINRTELPPGAEENVYARMRAERERLARKHRAEGEEQARTIRADADRRARVIVAEAREKAERLRGEGEAEAARIYADAYARDLGFYEFVRSLDAYRKTLGEGTTLVLPPEHEFFHTLNKGGSDLRPSAPPPVAAPAPAPAAARPAAAARPPAAAPAPVPAPPPAAAPEPPPPGAVPPAGEATAP
jgi:membrane protease subunit HflC